ncbi:MAG: hypothetical protein KJZ77_06570 [Anaerolineales bacterium]|nr:hypothetical protein [Anaerolineales bacterium]
MRRILLISAVLLSLLSVYGFSSFQGTDGGSIVVLNRSGQVVSQITDGDMIRIQGTLSQPAEQTSTITFYFDDKSLSIGSCTLARGDTDCSTEAAPSFGWY